MQIKISSTSTTQAGILHFSKFSNLQQKTHALCEKHPIDLSPATVKNAQKSKGRLKTADALAMEWPGNPHEPWEKHNDKHINLLSHVIVVG